MTYLVCYQPENENQYAVDLLVKVSSWKDKAKVMPNVWVVNSAQTLEDFYSELVQCIGEDDTLAVFPVEEASFHIHPTMLNVLDVLSRG